MAFKCSTAEAPYLLILGCVCGIVFFANLGSIPFTTRASPGGSSGARHRLERKLDFSVEARRADSIKAALFHWVGALASLFWGQMTEATVRFPSALFASLGVFLVYYLGKKLYDPLTGTFAGTHPRDVHRLSDGGRRGSGRYDPDFWLTLA